MKDMPPLEMGVDYENGDLANITFFADPSCIKDEKVLHTDCYQGNLIISTNIFQKVNDYVDINETYEVYIQDKKCVCMFKTMEKLAKIYRNGRLEVYLNNQNMVIGIGISNLSDTELQLFRDV